MRTLYPGFLGIACLAFVLSCSDSVFCQSQQADSGDGSLQKQATVAASPISGLPDSPGYVLLAASGSAQNQEGQSSTAAAPASNTAQAPKDKPQRPVGTAAAEAPKVSGITAAQPAGVAIAPGKQRRVRRIVLKVGAIVGAGAAVGTVIALTAGTSSNPPGAH